MARKQLVAVLVVLVAVALAIAVAASRGDGASTKSKPGSVRPAAIAGLGDDDANVMRQLQRKKLSRLRK